MRFKKAVLTLTLAFATAGLSSCAPTNSSQGVSNPAQQTTVAQGGLNGAVIYAANCIIRGAPATTGRYNTISYDFKYGLVTMDDGVLDTRVAYSIPFNAISNPQVQQEILTAHTLLPGCPKPQFAAPAV